MQRRPYVVAFTHVDGQPLDGANRYTLRFEKARFPGYTRMVKLYVNVVIGVPIF
jgi:hypothetical protein